MAEKTSRSVRLDDDTFNFIKSLTPEEDFSKGLVYGLSNLSLLIHEATDDLRGRFTIKEWKFIAEVLKVNKPMDSKKSDRAEIANRLFNNRVLTNYRLKYGIKVNDMQRRVYELNRLHMMALIRRVENFWVSVEGYDPSTLQELMDEWADF